MLEWLKSMWAKYKVHVSIVGGALVIASVYGKCTIEPDVDAIEEAVEEAADEAATNATIESSNAVPATFVDGDNVITVTTDGANTESTDATGITAIENSAEEK